MSGYNFNKLPDGTNPIQDLLDKSNIPKEVLPEDLDIRPLS